MFRSVFVRNFIKVYLAHRHRKDYELHILKFSAVHLPSSLATCLYEQYWNICASWANVYQFWLSVAAHTIQRELSFWIWNKTSMFDISDTYTWPTQLLHSKDFFIKFFVIQKFDESEFDEIISSQLYSSLQLYLIFFSTFIKLYIPKMNFLHLPIYVRWPPLCSFKPFCFIHFD